VPHIHQSPDYLFSFAVGFGCSDLCMLLFNFIFLVMLNKGVVRWVAFVSFAFVSVILLNSVWTVIDDIFKNCFAE